jgi:hypothetical protein
VRRKRYLDSYTFSVNGVLSGKRAESGGQSGRRSPAERSARDRRRERTLQRIQEFSHRRQIKRKSNRSEEQQKCVSHDWMSADSRRRCAFECDPRRPALLHGHLLFVQVVGHGDDKKQNHHGAGHSDDFLPVTVLQRRARAGARKFCPQQHKPQQRYAYPHEIEREFHE